MRGGHFVLPSYVLPLPMELNHHVMTFLLHPDTNLRHHIEIQRKYILTRLDRMIQRLERTGGRQWNHDEEFQYLSSAHVLGRMARVIRRKKDLCGVIATVWTTRYAFPSRTKEILRTASCPEYTRELKLWFQNEWHKNFLRAVSHSTAHAAAASACLSVWPDTR